MSACCKTTSGVDGKRTGTYRLRDDWLTVRLYQSVGTSERELLLQIFRSVIFRQVLEPPRCKSRHTIVEGRPMVGAERRIAALGIVLDHRVTFCDEA